MNRREFLQILGLAPVVAAAPKFIFDMGANLYKPEFQGIVGTIGSIECVDFHMIIREARTNAIRPVKIDGKYYYHMILHPSAVVALREAV